MHYRTMQGESEFRVRDVGRKKGDQRLEGWRGKREGERERELLATSMTNVYVRVCFMIICISVSKHCICNSCRP